MQLSLRYLGQIIDQDRIHPLNDKIEVIELASPPEDTNTAACLSWPDKLLPKISSKPPRNLTPFESVAKKRSQIIMDSRMSNSI